MKHLSYQDALNIAASALAEAAIEAPRREARLLLAHLLKVPARALPPENAVVSAARLHVALARRASHEPLAFITGTQGFWTIEVEVSPATLIPRADSETLIEAAIAAFPDRAAVRSVLDLGTGTGCLLLAALSEFPTAFGIGVDREPEAASLAARNAARLGLASRAAFLAGDWGTALATRFDLVLCNPPYIASAAIVGLMPEVARHEPALALDGGADGMQAYATLMPTLESLLSPGGVAILELGAGQAPNAAALARATGFNRISARPDLGGTPRAMLLHGTVDPRA